MTAVPRNRFTFLLAVAVLLGSRANALAADDPVIARVDGIELKSSEIKNSLDHLTPQERAKIIENHSLLTGFVRAELGRRALLQEAKAKKWDQQQDVLNRIERARTDIILTTYLNSLVQDAAPQPTDDQLHQVYNANLSRFMQPRLYHLAQIFIAKPTGGSAADLDAARAKAQDLLKRAKANPAGFADLAKANSDDKATAPQGGDIGFVPETELAPDFASAAHTMTDNEVSALVEAKDGWHILHEIGTKPAGPQSFDEVKPALINLIRQQEATRAAQLYVEKLLASKNAAVNEIELSKIADTSGH